MAANLGGTNIDNALNVVLNSRDMLTPTTVFILTDAEVRTTYKSSGSWKCDLNLALG